MRKFYTYSIFIISFLCIKINLQAQITLPLYHQPEQDLCQAYTVCSDTFFNYKSYMGVGVSWEILPGINPFAQTPPLPGPMTSHNEDSMRENSHWLKMVIAESGYLAFDLIPLSSIDFYKILVYKASSSGCENPMGMSLVRYASNKKDLFSAPTFTHTGIKLESSETSKNKAAPLYVNSGETYFIRILSASEYVEINPILTIAKAAKAGYILDLSKKTCRFEIGPPPLVAEIMGNGCQNGEFIDILLNRNINCNSIELHGSDFSLTPSGNINGALGTGCSFGEGLTSKIRLFYESNLAPGEYFLHIQEGTDGNTLLDLCYQESPSPQSIPFTVQKTKDTVNLYICKEAMPYTWNGITFSTPGSMIGSYKTSNVNGCDSTTYLNLFTVDSFIHYDTIFACDEIFPIAWHGGLSASDYGINLLRYVFMAEGGCDSIIYLTVLPQNIVFKDSQVVSCGAVEINGKVYSENASFIDTIYTERACISSIINYTVQVFDPIDAANIYIDTGSCSHLYIGERLFYKDTTFVDTFKTWYGCDSAYIHYNLSVTPNIEPEAHRNFIRVCDSFPVNGVVVYQDTILQFLYKNQYNCDSVIEIYYVVIDTLDLELVAFPQFPVKDEVIKIYAASTQPNLEVLQWGPEDFFEFQKTTYQTFVVNEPIIVSVMAKDSRGCMAIDTLQILQLDSLIKHEAIPNAFSPNGDGLNDYFTINIPNERSRELKSVHIYDKWGNVVFNEFGGTSFQWNGTYGNTGKAADAGVYYFHIVIRYMDGEEKIIKGDVTLIR